MPGDVGIGVVVGARGVVGGIELPDPMPVVVLPPIVPSGDVPSELVPLGEVPTVPVVLLLGKEVVVSRVGPPVVPIVPPVMFGGVPVVTPGVPGLVVLPAPRLVPPPPVPRLLLPLPAPALPPTVEPLPTLPPLAPPAAPLPAASAKGLASISAAAVSVAVVNRLVFFPVMRITCDVVPMGGHATGDHPSEEITDRLNRAFRMKLRAALPRRGSRVGRGIRKADPAAAIERRARDP